MIQSKMTEVITERNMIENKGGERNEKIKNKVERNSSTASLHCDGAWCF